ncbi:MAG TPA: MBL fold metallo-hydrolase [Ktedonobacterales bacterium]|nr:MBL fold metallo-hydrolase [Ktedonobacterales bacterium]
MKTTAHGDYLFQLTRLWAFNCYLVREDDGFTLVDTGLSGSAPAILDTAQALGAPIRRIALTHAHVDHVGSLDALHTLLPEAEVMISARDARFLTGDHSLDPEEPQVRLRGGYPICATKPTRMLAPGDLVGSLEVVASPGHTPGHVAFLDRRDRTLIAGDAFQTRGGLAVSGVIRPFFPLPAMATWHKATALRSASALRALEPARLAVGHGPVLEAPLAAMDQAIAVARRRFQESSTHAA